MCATLFTRCCALKMLEPRYLVRSAARYTDTAGLSLNAKLWLVIIEFKEALVGSDYCDDSHPLRPG